MIGNIFKQQQAYSKDLKDAIKSIKDNTIRLRIVNYRKWLYKPSEGSASANTSVKQSTNTNVQMIQDLFPHLDEKYIQVS
ncbi:unnamed protein product [Rotaria sordida]|uniref:Uncharacterized protein n=1 Tax=Rotaria sordida TaxID=392033 RepID=A0A814EDK8_9BILA|nr:unnamed protein product [Rotaria sordida]